jgi:hypothetical protein
MPFDPRNAVAVSGEKSPPLPAENRAPRRAFRPDTVADCGHVGRAPHAALLLRRSPLQYPS